MATLSLKDRIPYRASYWQLRAKRLDLPRRPLVMGIVNVTPDSFSDGGQYASEEAAIAHALRLADEGADIIDIGGESTRPYSDPVSEQQELRRVLPVVEAVCSQRDTPVSIDTSKARVAEAAIAAGAEIINDVTGLESDPRMVDVATESAAGICAMHMQGTPQTMQDNPTYENVVEEIFEYLAERRDALIKAGIDRERICLDPGIGFGKTHQHNIDLVAGCGRFHDLGCPILVGHSRKGFIAKVLGDKQCDRAAATLGISLALAAKGVQILRVHDVLATRQALMLFEAVGGIGGEGKELAPGD